MLGNTPPPGKEAPPESAEAGIDVEAKLLDERLNEPAPMQNSNEKAPPHQDNTCGFWILRGACLQRFANKTVYVLLYGLVGCVLTMTYAYFNGTITTIEKRYHIPSRNTGIISVGNNISQIIVAIILSFYAGKGHRPRWMSFGVMTIVIFCVLTAAPHFLYGPGEDALALTTEFGATLAENATMQSIDEERSKALCRAEAGDATCEVGEGNWAPQVVLFLAQFISGIGGALYYTLGISYMDDNTQKSEAPAMLSISFFINLLGPAVGYALAAFCLRIYIAPQLEPIINNNDPRWLGAWWMGWLILGGVLFVLGALMAMFPKELPKTLKRRQTEAVKNATKQVKGSTETIELTRDFGSVTVLAPHTTFNNMMKTFKRLSTNKILMYSNFSSVFYLFGYTPYWVFTPKYIEIQFRQSAATSSMATGSIPLVFTAIGILLSGFIISKFKPRARYLAGWNVIVALLTVAGIIGYSFIGCAGNEQSVVVNIPDSSPNSSSSCNSACHCDYVPYAPVCGENGMTYISACHAGCTKNYLAEDGTKIFYDCACIAVDNSSTQALPAFTRLTALDLASAAKNFQVDEALAAAGQAMPGACPVDCFVQFVTFLVVMCSLKFLGAAGRTSNLIVYMRCVKEQDKTAAMAFGMMMISLLTFIPSPIFFGWLLDRMCLVWGKTCTNKGNCWLYDPESLRYILNLTAAFFMAIATVLDCCVWYHVKDLKVFDEVVKDTDKQVELVPQTDKADKSAKYTSKRASN